MNMKKGRGLEKITEDASSVHSMEWRCDSAKIIHHCIKSELRDVTAADLYIGFWLSLFDPVMFDSFVFPRRRWRLCCSASPCLWKHLVEVGSCGDGVSSQQLRNAGGLNSNPFRFAFSGFIRSDLNHLCIPTVGYRQCRVIEKNDVVFPNLDVCMVFDFCEGTKKKLKGTCASY